MLQNHVRAKKFGSDFSNYWEWKFGFGFASDTNYSVWICKLALNSSFLNLIEWIGNLAAAKPSSGNCRIQFVCYQMTTSSCAMAGAKFWGNWWNACGSEVHLSVSYHSKEIYSHSGGNLALPNCSSSLEISVSSSIRVFRPRGLYFSGNI